MSPPASVCSHEDHLVVNEVLARVQSRVLPELIARYDPTLPAQRSEDPVLSLDIGAWRERAWRNAKRLRARWLRRRNDDRRKPLAGGGTSFGAVSTRS